MAAGALNNGKTWRSPDLVAEPARIGHWYVLSSSRGEPTSDIIFLEPIVAKEAVESAKMATRVRPSPGARRLAKSK